MFYIFIGIFVALLMGFFLGVKAHISYVNAVLDTHWERNIAEKIKATLRDPDYLKTNALIEDEDDRKSL